MSSHGSRPKHRKRCGTWLSNWSALVPEDALLVAQGDRQPLMIMPPYSPLGARCNVDVRFWHKADSAAVISKVT